MHSHPVFVYMGVVRYPNFHSQVKLFSKSRMTDEPSRLAKRRKRDHSASSEDDGVEARSMRRRQQEESTEVQEDEVW